LTTANVFGRVIGALEQAGIPYMLTGSFASSFHGLPRATQDIDIVISPTADQIRSLIDLLPPAEYYADRDAALDAQRERGQFNVIDFATGWKVDLIIRKSRPFSQHEFDRREVVEFQGMNMAIASAEDVLIAKLEWAKLSASSRQIQDAAGILQVREGELDLDYIRKWVERLDVEDQWRAACAAARPEA
jgi:hypothetical protein